MGQIERIAQQTPSDFLPHLERIPLNRNLNKIVSVTGVTGSGKDYLLMRTASAFGRTLNYGSLLSTALGKDRDDIRNSGNLNELQIAQAAAANTILTQQ